MAQTMTKTPTRQPRSWFGNGQLADVRREFEEMMEGLWDQDTRGNGADAIVPRFDVSETDKAIEVQTDLPGVKADDVNVELQDNRLVISAEHREEKKGEPEDGRRYHRIERCHGRFSRSVWLPSPVDEAGIEAKLVDGVLTVTLPKSEQAQKRRITVNGK